MMPAGTYYIGDLCYVMTDEEWDAVSDLTKNYTEEGEYEFVDGRRFAFYRTAYGDGIYEDNYGFTEYRVDSGSIGCFKIEHIQYKAFDPVNFDCGNLVVFEKPFETSYRDGKIIFGGLIIYTAPYLLDGSEQDGYWINIADQECEEYRASEYYVDDEDDLEDKEEVSTEDDYEEEDTLRVEREELEDQEYREFLLNSDPYSSWDY